MQTRPCSSRHFSGSGRNSQMRLNSWTFFSSLTRSHSSQQVLGDDAHRGALGRELALALERGRDDVEHGRDLVRLGGAARHVVVDVHRLVERLDGVVHVRQVELALRHRVVLLRVDAVGVVDGRLVDVDELLDLGGVGDVGEAGDAAHDGAGAEGDEELALVAQHLGDVLVLAVADAAVEQADVDEVVVVGLEVLVLEVGRGRPEDDVVGGVDLDDLLLDLEQGDLAAAAAAGPVHGELELASCRHRLLSRPRRRTRRGTACPSRAARARGSPP